jgi:4a-hydroxytetrahydrobiopterin dehydratase
LQIILDISIQIGMNQPSLLTKAQRQSLVGTLLSVGWTYECSSSETSKQDYLSHNPNEAICRAYDFRDFNDAFAFMVQVALCSEQQQHHPDWHNMYNKIHIKWSTHDVSGLSIKDIEMADLSDGLYRKFSVN